MIQHLTQSLSSFRLTCPNHLKSRLRWFGHIERKDASERVIRCMTWKVEEITREYARKKSGGIVLRLT